MELTPAALAEQLRDTKGTHGAVEFLNHLLESPAIGNSTYDLITDTLQLLKE